MADVTKTITAVPAGYVRLDLYEALTETGLYGKIAEIPVSEGQTEITFSATEGRWYKFRLVDAQGAAAGFSSAWLYMVSQAACLVTGKCVGADGQAAEGVTVTATLLAQSILTNQNEQIAGAVAVETNAAGEWGLLLVRTAKLADPNGRYLIAFSGGGFSETITVQIPDQDSVEYEDLVAVGSLSADWNLQASMDADCEEFTKGEVKFLTFEFKEAKGLVSTLPGVTAHVRLDKMLTKAEKEADPTQNTLVLDWTVATVDGMSARYLWDTGTVTARGYVARVRLTRDSERLIYGPFPLTVKE